MHKEPLLAAGRRRLPVDGIGCCLAWHSFWYRSWAATLTEEYLSSPTSRRRLWKYYGIFVTWCLIGDLVFALTIQSNLDYWFWCGFATYYVSEYVLAILFVRLPVTTLKSDALVVIYLFLDQWFSVVLWQQSKDAKFILERYSWPTVVTCKVVLCYAAGLHSLFVTLYAACFGMFICVLVSVSCAPEVCCQVFMITIVMTLFEWLLASYFHEMTEQLRAMQTLLDKATDGYCTVRRQMGTISHVSDSLKLLLGGDPRGTHILDAVGSEDRWKVARLYDASQWDVAEPVLATFTQALGEGQQPLEFDARLVPYRATGADIHISFQRVGEVRMVKRGLAEEVAGPRGPGSSGARPLDCGTPSLESRDVDRLLFPSPAAFQEHARAQPAALGEGGRAPMQNDAAGNGGCQSSAETVAELHISFDAGHPSFLINDGNCSRHLLPRQGQLVRCFPRSARDQVEKWIIDAVNNSVEPGICPEYLEHFELVIPPTPAIKIIAKRAFIMAEDPEENDTGAISLPATLCLEDVVMSRRHCYTTRARAHYSQDLSTIVEDLHPEYDSSSMNSSEDVSPSDSASVVLASFR
ncbi:unnamed protein product [Prorocentrum cordatum]|uniref:Uncharacterized protein n=1 Tax=Prorocentrum cordatum TaxID=2364126 RepID=A0ABN9SDF8_9DINO|nr:unnamed protein product [Polarella glacialis]